MTQADDDMRDRFGLPPRDVPGKDGETPEQAYVRGYGDAKANLVNQAMAEKAAESSNILNRISDNELTAFEGLARQDNVFDNIVPSDLRKLLGHLRRAYEELDKRSEIPVITEVSDAELDAEDTMTDEQLFYWKAGYEACATSQKRESGEAKTNALMKEYWE